MEFSKLKRDELNLFLNKSNWQAAYTIFLNWAIVGLSFVMVAWWPNPFTVILALVLIGGRQLGFGVLMHDCAHNAMFKSDKLNHWVGQWLCAAPILANIDTYWKIHARHHRLVGQADDPDLTNYQAYPVTRASLRRKMLRDLTGQTGVKILLGTFGRGRDLFSLGKEQVAEIDNETDITVTQHLLRPFIVNAILLVVLWLSGYPWLYVLWVVSYLTTYMLFARLRQVAEHGAVPELSSSDPLKNTRTTQARWWERLTLAPNHVNYHLEHHLYASVPPYRLASLHQYLKAKGYYKEIEFPKGYLQVMRQVTAE